MKPRRLYWVQNDKITLYGICMIELRNIYKSYGKKEVLNNINLSMSTKKIFGILGPNGAGKTTSFSILSGFRKPTKGSVHLDDQDITLLSLNKRAKLGIAYLPQHSSVFLDLTVKQNIMTSLELYYPKKEIQDKLQEIAEQLSISNLLNEKCRVLSGGQKRRVEIARTLGIEPKFLLFDEPFAGIDPVTIMELKELFCQLTETEDIGIIITDHNSRELLDMSDQCAIIIDGQVKIIGTQEEILQNAEVVTRYLGHS